jgi:transcriptional regulator with XRE-family HTH domain
MNMGERIRLLRNKKDFTLKDVSEKTNLSISFISDIENGRRTPRLENLQYIADALNVSIERLTGETASSIIEDRLKDIGMSSSELAEKSKVPLTFLKNLDDIVPDQEVDGGEECYSYVSAIAWTLDIPASRLRAALARQEVPFDEEPLPKSTPEEDFGPDMSAAEAPAVYGQELPDEIIELATRINKLTQPSQDAVEALVNSLEIVDARLTKEPEKDA